MLYREYTSSESKLRKEVFVSYAWGGESEKIVDQLEQEFSEKEITLVRDKSELDYKDSIQKFMRRIGEGKCIVVVISKKYLKSKNCMFELTEIAEQGELHGRVFPIVLEDAGIFETLQQIKYVKYWQDKVDELDTAMRTVKQTNLKPIQDEINLYSRIREAIAGLVGTLSDMNTLTPEELGGAGLRSCSRKLKRNWRSDWLVVTAFMRFFQTR